MVAESIMDYEHDVFLSYRRHGEWPEWVEKTFSPIFKHWLLEELGYDGEIFVDTTIETGTDWPLKLAEALSQSRVLVPLLSRQYFNSKWCVTELSLMMAREEKCGFSCINHPKGLIVPAHIHDGDDFPQEIKRIQAAQLQKYVNIRMATRSETEEKLSESIRTWVTDIAKAIKRAPEYDSSWHQIAAEKFVSQYLMQQSTQKNLPRLG